VGLPLALSFARAGLDVVGVDTDPRIRRAINEERRMPFLEPGFDDLVADGVLEIHEDMDAAGDADYWVVTVGTPLLTHIETDLGAVTRVTAQIAARIRPGQCVIMRSTTAPRTTTYVRKLLERDSRHRVGEDIGLACCPERILEGRADEELRTLPQVVGTADALSAEAAGRLFDALGVEVLHCDYTTAELVKLFNNVSRYAYFGIANVLAMIAIDYGAEPHEVLRLANHAYPRPILGKPGFTAGTCLRKDFGMLSEAYWNADIMVGSWRINESMPKFLVEAARDRWGDLGGRRVAVLGYTFKRDADDVRDTLSAKLLRYLHRECPAALVVQDHFIDAGKIEPLQGLAFTQSYADAVAGADLVFVATNHSLYTERRDVLLDAVRAGRCRVVDLWNALGTGRVFVEPEAEATA